jgi:arabinofuranosyltransferase
MALIVCVFLAHVIYLNCLAEDAFIALRFARNLAHGDGLVWNPGQPPVEGYTDFLWVVLSAVAIKLGISGVAFAQVLSIACGLGTLLLTYAIGRRLAGWPPVVAMVPAGLLAVSGPMAMWSSSAMESTFFTMLVLAATYCLARFWRSGSVPAALATSGFLWMATLTRPEGLMFAGLLLGVSVIVAAAWDRRALWQLGLAAATFAGLFVPYFIWRYQYFGFLLPNTFYAKTGGGLLQVLRGGLLAYLFLMQFALPLVPALLVTLWEGGPRKNARPEGKREKAQGSIERFRQHAFFVFAALIVIAYTAYNVLVGGDYMAMHRFFVPVLPFMYLLFGLPIAFLHARASERGNQTGLAVLVAFTALATFFPSTPLERWFFVSVPQQFGAYRGVGISRWHVRRLAVIGQFFDRYRRNPSESLATTAIGAIGYYANMQVYDIHGLVDTHIAHLPPPPDFAKHRPGHGRKDLPYTFSLNPTYVMFSRDLTAQPIELWSYLSPALRPSVDRDYVHQSVWLQDEANGESGYFTFFERRDSAGRRAAGARSD